MRRTVIGCVMGSVLVLGMPYAKRSFAMEIPKMEGSNCRAETNYHNRVCAGWSELTELQHPSAWDYAVRSHHEEQKRWYGVEGVVAEKMIKMILEGVQFDFDKSNLRPDTIPILERNVAKLKSMKINRINVIGYTDSKGTEAYNQSLSERRARAVKDYLVKQGIASDRIAVEGRGESGEIAPNVTPSGKDNPAGRAKNRRAIELQIWTR